MKQVYAQDWIDSELDKRIEEEEIARQQAPLDPLFYSVDEYSRYMNYQRASAEAQRWKRLSHVWKARSLFEPIYGSSFIHCIHFFKY